MGRNSEMEGNGQALLRIVAVLSGFALLAEREACQPAPVRQLVLAILRSAESVARKFVSGQTDTLYSIYPAGRFGDDTAEATRLAQSFRALASALDVLCSIVVWAVRRPARSCRRPVHEIHEVLADLRCFAREALARPDTS